MTIKAFKPWLLKSKLDGLGTLSTSVSTRMCKSLIQFNSLGIQQQYWENWKVSPFMFLFTILLYIQTSASNLRHDSRNRWQMAVHMLATSSLKQRACAEQVLKVKNKETQTLHLTYHFCPQPRQEATYLNPRCLRHLKTTQKFTVSKNPPHFYIKEKPLLTFLINYLLR